MKKLISLFASLLTLLIPFPFESFSIGGEHYQPSEGPHMGSWTEAPTYYFFYEPWGWDCILVRIVMILIGWGICYLIISKTFLLFSKKQEK